MASAPDYSPFAGEYARSRPRYPAALYAHLAALAPGRGCAWDCATGNGQAAHGLAEHFERVIATDASAEQIRHAALHPRIEYRVAPAESTDLDPLSVDLVTVATAAHWFDHQRFERELRRVVRPRGVLAVWTYHVAHLEGPCGEILGRFYGDVVQPYFGAGARHVDRRYETLPVPGTPLAPGGPFFVTAEWTRAQILAFVSSWSGTQAYVRERGVDPLPGLAAELERVGGAQAPQVLRWPIYLKVARL